jgi:hypothetical protein
MFYLKTQAGWRETSVQEITGANGEAIQHAVSIKIEFDDD